MLRSLWSSASGMIAQQTNLDVVANNLANVNTSGYKRKRADFQDLLYQIDRQPGTPVEPNSTVPTGVQVGLGTRVIGTPSFMTEGNLQVTDNPLDWAIAGEQGYFQVTMQDGTIGYTRAGAWQVDGDGQIVSHDGLLLEPAVIIPQDAVSIMLSPDGVVSVKLAGQTATQEIGQLELARFVNPAGLLSIGSNLFLETDASGAPILAAPGVDGMSEIRQGILEMSNVQVVDEMVGMIIAQRAYEANSKGVQTADDLLRIANGLKR
ncbi:MAG: flagellar basal-body rod protein FlgG [Synergistaceae bacterium]|nr:flagellar basal-body rod protein FlgG [Synergistaceae bacterium]